MTGSQGRTVASRSSAALAPAAIIAGSALCLIGLAHGGRGGAAAGWFVVQLAVAIALPRLLRLPSPAALAAVAGLGLLAVDVVAATGFPSRGPRPGGYDSADSTALRGVAAALAVAFLVAVVHQLATRQRARVTEALAATVGATVIGSSAGGYVALARDSRGVAAVTAALLGVVAAIVVGRVVDWVWPAPVLLPATSDPAADTAPDVAGVDRAAVTRGLPGALAALAAAALAGAGYGAATSALSVGGGFAIAAVAAVLAVAADVGVALGSAGLAADRWAVLAVSAGLPLLLTAAPAYVVARAALS